jgi:hypothetical protein
MCPVCVAAVAWIAAGTTSTGGISALVVSRLRGRNEKPDNENPVQGERKGERDGADQGNAN